MQRASPVKRRRIRVRSRSPTPVHYIDLTADSPVTTTSRISRRTILIEDNNARNVSPDLVNLSAHSLGMETIEISDTSEPVRSRTARKQSNNNRNSNQSPSVDLAIDENLKEGPVDCIPAINDSCDGITPTVLSCPICYEDLRSSRKPMATKCGHLFCETCIQASLSSRKKCPVCMASVTIKTCIRVHF